ncbi:MAG: hypothetical protein ACYS15_00700 [Planctomycetota bacterium]|jgi:hypothetical protein
MNRRQRTVAASGLIALMSCLPAGHASPRDRSSPGRADVLALKRIDELRRADVVKADDNGFEMSQPGLVLTFGIRLPIGRRVVEVQEPAQVTAVDSTGSDLTQIEANIFGRREHLELVHVWNEPPSRLKFTLALPRRQATSFDLSTTIGVVTDTGSHDVVMDVGTDWTQLDPKIFPGTNAVARLKQGKRDLELELKPGTIRATIEKVQIISGGEPLESYSSMWSDLGLMYSFQGTHEPGMKAKLTLRNGLQTMPVTIALDGQLLP